MSAKNIDQVIARLEEIVEEASARKDPLGIFAIVYLGVTRAVKEGIRQHVFQDGDRMERLDVAFANRYLYAHDAYRHSQACTQAWQTTFNAAMRFDLLVLQHLFMGMNAHINLDLGIAAAEVVPPEELPGLEEDFNRINALLVARIDEIQGRLCQISPLLFLVDWFGKNNDERFAEFSLVKARNNAWKAATRLSGLPLSDKTLEINELDNYVAILNKVIASPGIFFGAIVRFIKWFEVKDMGVVMKLLRD